MSKKTRCRVLSLLLALVMVLGMVPMASASSAYNVKLTPTTPDASKLSTAIQQNKFKLQNGEEAYADNDTVRAIVIFEGEGAVPAALKSTGVATQRAVAAASKTLTAQHSRIKTAIQSKAVSYDVKYEYTTLLNGMSADVKFGDLDGQHGRRQGGLSGQLLRRACRHAQHGFGQRHDQHHQGSR